MKVTKKYKVYIRHTLPGLDGEYVESIVAICSTEKQAVEYCKQSYLYYWDEIDWVEE